jgi:hypothetical protein
VLKSASEASCRTPEKNINMIKILGAKKSVKSPAIQLPKFDRHKRWHINLKIAIIKQFQNRRPLTFELK